jgi:hypothetical protein
MLIPIYIPRLLLFMFVLFVGKALSQLGIAKSWLVYMHAILGVQPHILVFVQDVYKRIVTKSLTKTSGDFQESS